MNAPMIHRFLTTAAAGFDRAMTSAVLYGRKRAPSRHGPESLGHAARMLALAEVRDLYGGADPIADPTVLFPAPGPVDPRLTHVRAIPGGEVVDAVWSSEFSPYCAAVAERYLGHPENRLAAARLFLHEGSPRPAAILIHGYRCGQFSFEERVWPVRWLFERGLDVALAVLPFHAVRADRTRRGPPPFPANDPRVTNEGFRQAILDVRSLARLLVDRGSPCVGAMGMSLGGYTTALLATLEPSLAFAVPIIPLASIADVARQSRRFVGTEEEQRLQHEALDAAHRVVSPLARPARIAKDRILVIGAAGDQITPIEHARRLADHYDAPLETIPGGHVLQFGRAQGFRAIGRMLGRLGLFSERR